MDNTVINTLAENTEERKVCVQDKPLTAAEQAEGSDATAILGESAEIPYYQQRQKTFGYKCYLFFKRAFDLIFSGFLILALSWLYIIIALAVKLADGGSVFYIHLRIGKNGKNIKIAKFRSMKKDADKLQNSLSVEELEDYKKEYKLDNDPRITKIGKFLRKTSLDELPNLFAVFSGKISIVGPRPLMRCEVYEKYGNDAEKLLSVKPGMTGWWAVNGRNSVAYKDGKRQALELYYVDKCSAWFDLKVMFKTIGCVFKRKGAK